MKMFGIISGVIIMVGIILVVSVRAYTLKKAMAKLTPYEIEQFEIWKTKKLKFASEDLEVKPFSETTLAAATAFLGKYNASKNLATKLANQYKELAKQSQIQPASTDWMALREGLDEVKPVLEAFENLIAQPDYQMQALPASDVQGSADYFPIPDSRSFLVSVRLLALKSLILSREGKHAEALLAAEAIVEASQFHKYASLYSQIIGIYAFKIGAQSWQEAVRQCDDQVLLSQTAERQKALLPKSPLISTDVPLMVLDQLGTILEAKRAGFEVNIQGLTGQEILGESCRVSAEYLEKKILPLAKDDAERSARLHESIKRYRAGPTALGGETQDMKKMLIGWVRGDNQPLVLYSIATPNFGEMQVRNNVAISNFDLLRIQTAKKLFALEKGREASGIAELVPDYLPEAPKDLFAKGNQGYGFAKTGVYSIGPDGQDQGGALVYDSTNGTRSAGDILLKVR